jgi:hypothetical protein
LIDQSSEKAAFERPFRFGGHFKFTSFARESGFSVRAGDVSLAKLKRMRRLWWECPNLGGFHGFA